MASIRGAGGFGVSFDRTAVNTGSFVPTCRCCSLRLIHCNYVIDDIEQSPQANFRTTWIALDRVTHNCDTGETRIQNYFTGFDSLTPH